jgi:hypothetical protein
MSSLTLRVPEASDMYPHHQSSKLRRLRERFGCCVSAPSAHLGTVVTTLINIKQ